MLLSDTVGFIRALPHQLVTAFSATLEEAREADLLLHVADASEPEGRRAAQADAVAEVLDEIGASDVPRMLVLNKIDLADADQRIALSHRHPGALRSRRRPARASRACRACSPRTARARLTRVDMVIPYSRTALIADVYAAGSEVEQESTEEGTRVRALMAPAAAARIRQALGAGNAALERLPGVGGASPRSPAALRAQRMTTGVPMSIWS